MPLHILHALMNDRHIATYIHLFQHFLEDECQSSFSEKHLQNA
ncbi:MAG: hypothetical protein PHS99_02295 [Candidatus Marinimicrobia bacterium]|nr:hypothetical protein [Candidatus Neomarinimicrobiota bacterium]